MSGYTGNADLGSEMAAAIADGGIALSRMMLIGTVSSHCNDCGDPILDARRQNAIRNQMKCEYCIDCQVMHDRPPKMKMLDRIL